MQTVRELASVKGRDLLLHFHPGQWQAWESERRWVVVLAGTQSGKTSFGPHWLYREIQRRGPGDYMVVTPTFQLLELKALPELLRLFERTLSLGRYVSSPARKFVFSREGEQKTFEVRGEAQTQILFGYAADPESLEAMTAKAVWGDEAGQKKWKRAAWEAIRRRLAINQGRGLLTTTPYDLGWLKQEMYDRAKAGDADIEIVNFASTMNPAFPRAEYDQARETMPAWKFNMFYRGLFERPAGLIYDCFDTAVHAVPRFTIPREWPRFLGLDFGPVHTAALYIAEDPGTKKLYEYREYQAGGRTAREHVTAMLSGEPGVPQVVGGSRSEDAWRREFRDAGLPVREPDAPEVEIGIDRVYAATKQGTLYTFDDLYGTLEQKGTYSRVLDVNGDPTDEIEEKATYHLLDAERYIVGWLKRDRDSRRLVTW